MLLRHQVRDLQSLVFVQRAIRILLRAAWLGLAGYLLGWALAELNPFTGAWSERLSDDRLWLGLGLALAGATLLRLPFAWPPARQLTWAADRRLGLFEQLSTGLGVAQAQPVNALERGLLIDVLRLLPTVNRRVLWRGWNLGGEALSLVLVAVLFIVVNLSGVGDGYPQVASNVSSLPLAALPDDPAAAALFPKGRLGLAPDSADANATGETTASPQAEAAQLAPAAQQLLEQIGQNLEDLGGELAEMAATHELGQALQDRDLEKAASVLDDLAGQVDKLSDSTRDGLADAMQQAANGLPAQGLEPLQQLQDDLRQAADQVAPPPVAEQPEIGAGPQPPKQLGGDVGAGAGEGGGSPAGAALNQVADDLRALSEVAQALGMGSAAGNAKGELGQAEPAARLQGGGSEQFSLKMNENDPALAGILNPQVGQPGGQGVAQGSYNLSGLADQQIVSTYIIPYSYLWMWRNVVSSYFQP